MIEAATDDAFLLAVLNSTPVIDGMPADGVYQEQFVVWELANAATVSGASTLTKWDMIKF